MRLSEVLGLSRADIDFAAKRINLCRQMIFLLSELRRWQAQQIENEKQLGSAYVYIYHGKGWYVQR